jgi:dipeptidyl aminopeptidase/acylaminoacyl peptidase
MRFQRVPFLWITSGLLGLFVGSAEADPQKRSLQLEDLWRLEELESPALSPKGEQVAYVVRRRMQEADRWDSDLWVVPTAGGAARQLTRDEAGNDTAPQFSPDGRYLAFLSDRGGSQQVWQISLEGGEPEKLTNLPGGVEEFAWSPDGRFLVVTANDPPAVSQEDKQPIVLRRLQFKMDGIGFLTERYKHLYLVDLRTRTHVALTRGPFDHSEPRWSPSGELIAFVSNRTPEPDSNFDTDIWLMRPYPGAEPLRVSAPGREDRAPSFSFDGRRLVWLEGGDPGDFWYASNRVAWVEIGSNEIRRLGIELDRQLESPHFDVDGTSVLVRFDDHGRKPLLRLGLSGEAAEEVRFGEEIVENYVLSPNGVLVVQLSSHQAPSSLWRIDRDPPIQLVESNPWIRAEIALAPVERFEVLSQDRSTTIEAFRYLPAGKPPWPTLLSLHGGPVAQHAAEFDFWHQWLAAEGYLVLAPNPRGSSGRGTAFSRAIFADWGNLDVQDVLAVLDAEVAGGRADAARLGVFGWSYGGILTNYVVTKTDRFRAAVSGASETNYLANYGHDHYQREWELELGLPWRNRELWLKLSPFFDVEKITTPMLLLCGSEDWNVPLINSEQLFQALRRLGRTAELVVYPGEGHGIKRPSFQYDRLKRHLSWFDRYVKGVSDPVVAPAYEAQSLFGWPLARPELPKSVRERREADLQAALERVAKEVGSREAQLQVARRLGELGRFREGLAVLDGALGQDPEVVELRWNRGYFRLMVRDLEGAISDLDWAAARIAAGAVPDRTKVEGLLGEDGDFSTTLHFNVHFLRGFGFYLKGEWARAVEAMREAFRVAKGKAGMERVAGEWLYLSLMRSGEVEAARKVLEELWRDAELIEKGTYRERLELYRGERGWQEVLDRKGRPGEVASRTYAVAMEAWFRGDRARARMLLERVAGSSEWWSLAVLAAEADLARGELERP